MKRTTMFLCGFLHFCTITLIGIPALCDENTDSQNIKTRMALYFKWIRGTATQEEREIAARTIVQDSTIGITLAAIIAGGAIGSIRWMVTWCKQRAAVGEFLKQLRELNSTTKSKEMPSFDIPGATISVRICTYDGATKKNIIFLISDENVTWQSLPVLRRSIELLCNQGFFDKIQVHKIYRQEQDQVLYVTEKKDGKWHEAIYPNEK